MQGILQVIDNGDEDAKMRKLQIAFQVGNSVHVIELISSVRTVFH